MNTAFAALTRAGMRPHYSTSLGRAYLGDSAKLLRVLPDRSIAVILTSPPFGLRRKKSYGNPSAENYIEWFRQFASEALRVLRDDGSFVIEIGGSWTPRVPTRSLYNYELLIDLVRNIGFHLAQDFFWYNPAKMPGPAQWVTIDRVRCTDAVSTIWWLSKSSTPKANNKQVLVPYSDSMRRLFKHGYNNGTRPSGHNVSDVWATDNGGAIPKNLLSFSNTSSSDNYQVGCRRNKVPPHPARFPLELPRFFVDFLTTSKQDIILDIFAGSNVTGYVAESAGRKWLAFESRRDFLEASKFRFGLNVDLEKARSK